MTYVRCSCQGHNKYKCTNTEVRCCDCGEHHQAFSRKCPINTQTEIVQIQTKERIPRLQTIRKLLRLNPNPKIISSNRVKTTSNRNTSKSSPHQNKKVNSNLVKTTHRLYRPTATDSIFREKIQRKGARRLHR